MSIIFDNKYLLFEQAGGIADAYGESTGEAVAATHSASGRAFTVIIGSAAHQAARATAAIQGGKALPRPLRRLGLIDLTPVYGVTSA